MLIQTAVKHTTARTTLARPYRCTPPASAPLPAHSHSRAFYCVLTACIRLCGYNPSRLQRFTLYGQPVCAARCGRPELQLQCSWTLQPPFLVGSTLVDMPPHTCWYLIPWLTIMLMPAPYRSDHCEFWKPYISVWGDKSAHAAADSNTNAAEVMADEVQTSAGLAAPLQVSLGKGGGWVMIICR